MPARPTNHHRRRQRPDDRRPPEGVTAFQVLDEDVTDEVADRINALLDEAAAQHETHE